MNLKRSATPILFFAAAAGTSVSPYIDSIREQMPRKESSPGSYTEEENKKLKAAENAEGYSEQIRKQLPPKDTSSQGYTDSQKRAIPQKPEGGAIQAVNEGRSELKMKRTGEIKNAFGFRVGAGLDFDITADPGYQGRTFDDVYGAKYAPDFAFTYEFQPFRSEILGNIGIVTNVGLGFHRGKGTFETTLTGFGNESRTNFFFWTIPVTIGANYRFNLFRILRPYVFVGPSLIGFVESRDDDRPSKTGYSTALNTSFGVALLLDWISQDSAWNYYQDFGVKHYYLTVEYQKLTPITGIVNVASSGIYAGFLFEF